MHILAMVTTFVWLALCFAAGSATPAAANGTVRVPAPVVVPVPAPAPVPEFAADYYVRLDISYDWSDSHGFKTEYDVYAPTIREDSGFDEYARYGFGFGMYLSRWLRADVTIDVRNELTGDADGTVIYTSPLTGLERTDVITDSIRSRNWTGLVNGYIDIPVGHTFTPYVGAGVGVVLHTISRTLDQTITCSDLAVADCDPSTPGVQGTGTTIGTYSGSDKDYAFAFAGALMVGASYDFSHNTHFDFGYRFLYLDGATFSMNVGSGNPNQHVTIDDQVIHELRLGLRFDIR